MKIKPLIENIRGSRILGSLGDADIKGIVTDSRESREGVLFVAVRGPSQDGHRYIADALKKNAAAVVLEDEAYLPVSRPPVPYILVKDSKAALGKLADVFFGHPYQHIFCVGMTGTNGKTTVSYLVRNILAAAGKKCGLIGTIAHQIDEAQIPSLNTTPGIIELHKLTKQMIEAGNQYVAMEVSSHALDQERVMGMVFKAVIFTNLTQDHLDYHKTMEEYFCAKEKLFKEYADQQTAFIINQDDAFGRRLIASLKGRILRYGFSPESDVRVENYELSREGSRFAVKTPRGVLEITTSLAGKHNISNILAALAFGLSENIETSDIIKGIEGVSSVPGRLERIDDPKGFSVFIDYAHTDDALKNVLESLRVILHNGRIISVFGCGGDRDKGKRPKMGHAATTLSDFCFITSDNPRNEEPMAIIKDIVTGAEKNNFAVEADRMTAIRKAVQMAQKGDFILVAGKGHESYQMIKDQVVPFNDREAVLKVLAELKNHV